MTNALVFVVPQPPVSEISDAIQGDRRFIAETAATIRNILAGIDNAAVYITAGREFKILHDQLSKHDRHDRKRIGWVRAFLEPEGKFGVDRRTAERYIKIFEAFGQVGAIVPTCKLPQALRALDLLATLKLSPTVLARYLLDEQIGPNTTAIAIRKLGITLGCIEPTTKKPEEPAAVRRLASMTLKERRRCLAGAKAHEILEACDATAHAELEERGLQAAELKKRATRLRFLPAPDRHAVGGSR